MPNLWQAQWGAFYRKISTVSLHLLKPEFHGLGCQDFFLLFLCLTHPKTVLRSSHSRGWPWASDFLLSSGITGGLPPELMDSKEALDLTSWPQPYPASAAQDWRKSWVVLLGHFRADMKSTRLPSNYIRVLRTSQWAHLNVNKAGKLRQGRTGVS